MGTVRGRMVLGGQLFILGWLVLLMAPEGTSTTSGWFILSTLLRLGGFGLALVFNTPVPLTADRQVDLTREEKPTFLDTLAYDLERLPSWMYTVASFLRECCFVLLMGAAMGYALTLNTSYEEYVLWVGNTGVVLSFLSNLIAFSKPRMVQAPSEEGGGQKKG